jgi:plastocyanin
MNGRGLGWLGTALVAAGIALLAIGSVISPPAAGPTDAGWTGAGWTGAGMMGGAWSGPASAPGPGQAGFVAGTPATPRVVRIVATPQLRFSPDVVTILAGETITFEVPTMGPTVHEFMVGPAAAVAVDTAGTPEIADVGMMQTKSLTYAFSGPGPFAYACHVAGHYEAGMMGTIVVH